MSSEPHRMIFQGEAVHFSLAAGGLTPPTVNPVAPPVFFADGDQNRFVASQYGSQNPRWNLDHRSLSDGSDDEDDEDDVVDEGDDDGEDFDEGDGYSIKNGSAQSSSEKGNGMSRGAMAKDRKQRGQHEGVVNFENVITVVEPELYCGQILNGSDGLGSIRKDNGNGFGGRKEVEFSVDPWAALRMHLLDPITGVLMDDAMILPCGHSFGHGGMLHIFKMKACCKCSHPISEDLVRPNLALRSAVQAFKKEASQSSKLSNRGKERLEQETCNFDNPYPMDSRTKHVQFPLSVSDRVIIKGNKRTPQRFVGLVGIVTSQCLNGWYVVKTLDNAESLKLQYRSLAKFTDNTQSSMIQSKSITPNWL